MIPVVDEVPTNHPGRPANDTCTKVAFLALHPLPLRPSHERCRCADDEPGTGNRCDSTDLGDLARSRLRSTAGSSRPIGARRDHVGDRGDRCTGHRHRNNDATDASLDTAPRHRVADERHR